MRLLLFVAIALLCQPAAAAEPIPEYVRMEAARLADLNGVPDEMKPVAINLYADAYGACFIQGVQVAKQRLTALQKQQGRNWAHETNRLEKTILEIWVLGLRAGIERYESNSASVVSVLEDYGFHKTVVDVTWNNGGLCTSSDSGNKESVLVVLSDVCTMPDGFQCSKTVSAKMQATGWLGPIEQLGHFPSDLGRPLIVLKLRNLQNMNMNAIDKARKHEDNPGDNAYRAYDGQRLPTENTTENTNEQSE